MSQQYLYEDLAQIQRYFPGAEPIALVTPFDSSIEPRELYLQEDNEACAWLSGVLLWTI